MRNEENSVLIVGATGTVGQEAIRAVAGQGGRIRALVRSDAAAAQLPPGATAVRGDLRDQPAIERALRGVRAALYVSPHEPDEEALAERFVRACETARVRLVFVGVHLDGANRFTRAVRRFVYGRMLPHYRPKFRIAERARSSDTDPIVLMPTNFFQNDSLFRDDILSGTFPTPFEKPVNRVDVRDLGDAIARALLDRALPSGAYPVVGPRSLTGDACAAIWAAALGSDVRCAKDQASVDAALGRALAAKKRDDFVKTYAVLRRFELPTSAAEVARTEALIGHAPTSYEAYVRAAVAAWRAAAPELAPPPRHQAYASGASPVGGKI